MKDLMKLVEECKKDLSSIGIPYRQVQNWSINQRSLRRWGQCRKVRDGVFNINISVRLLDDNVDDQAAKDTIAHELLHTVEGCLGHKGRWKLLAARVNRKLPQYTIKRTTTPSEKGIPTVVKTPTYRYKIICENCGVIDRRQKASKLVKNPDAFYCIHCGGSLSVEEISMPSQQYSIG